ncbi:MAG: hypothetical protein R3C53_10200 [Pirellulaceae bacterium]
MSIAEVRKPIALGRGEVEYGMVRPPLSKLAVSSFVVGLTSLLAPLSFALLPLSLLAIAAGAIAVWRVTHNGSVRGKWLATIGLALGVISGAWCVAATATKTSHLFTKAGQYANIYLDHLSQGRLYDALELRLPVRERQIAGTDLEKYYQQLASNPADHTGEIVTAAATQAAIGAGKDAKWQFLRGVQIAPSGSQTKVVVEMVNAKNAKQVFRISFRRELVPEESGEISAYWLVLDAELVDSNRKSL